MKAITMTEEQTVIYDEGDDAEVAALLRDLRAEAQRLADFTGETVEIYTADGIVVEATR